MNLSSSAKLMGIGLVLLLVGIVLPFLMVMRILPTTFALNFLSYIASVVGLFLGIIGIAMRSVKAIRKDPRDKYY